MALDCLFICVYIDELLELVKVVIWANAEEFVMCAVIIRSRLGGGSVCGLFSCGMWTGISMVVEVGLCKEEVVASAFEPRDFCECFLW